MPELPESVVMARQMHETLKGKCIHDVTIHQPKCLNHPTGVYQSELPNQNIRSVQPFGKWIRIELESKDRLMISLGMGGELLHFTADRPKVSEKSRFTLRFTDQSGFFVTLWWFGYIHFVRSGDLHPMTDAMGPDPLQMTEPLFHELLRKRKGAIKPFLLNQKRIRGIGNFYIQEILFQARLHPLQLIPSLSVDEICRLFKAIQHVMLQSIQQGSSGYELDFFGQKGGYNLSSMSFAYQEGGCCPECGSPAEKIKTGSTSQYICPKCQRFRSSMQAE